MDSLFCGKATAVASVHRTLAKSRLSSPVTSTKKEEAKASSFLVLVTGLEPVRVLPQGILSPWCLPIPPHQLIMFAVNTTTFPSFRQGNKCRILQTAYIISISVCARSRGSSQKCLPPAASKVLRSRKPQVTLKTSTPVFLAVRTSTSLSPT